MSSSSSSSLSSSSISSSSKSSSSSSRFVGTFFDEKFEGAGYEESGWEETLPAGATIDEDNNTTDVNSPSGWGNQCLKVRSFHDGAYVENVISSEPIIYWRIEFIIKGFDATSAILITGYEDEEEDPPNKVFELVYETDILTLYCYHNGNSNSYTSFVTPALNTHYRFEFKWDATNDKWAWKINGVSQPNDQDSSDPVESEGSLTNTHPLTCAKIQLGPPSLVGVVIPEDAEATLFYDLIACNNTNWMGEQSSSSSSISSSSSSKSSSSSSSLSSSSSSSSLSSSSSSSFLSSSSSSSFLSSSSSSSLSSSSSSKSSSSSSKSSSSKSFVVRYTLVEFDDRFQLIKFDDRFQSIEFDDRFQSIKDTNKT